MKHVSINELVRETGLSRSTIDRALNGRGRVHQRTLQLIEETQRRLQASESEFATELTLPSRVAVDVVLRVGRGMTQQLSRAFAQQQCDGVTLHDMYLKSDEEFFQLVKTLCRDTTRPLVLTAKHTELLRDELISARRSGKRIITFISDLQHDERDAFVGIANRMAGQTAAFLLGNQLQAAPAKVGIVLGDYAFSCHEDREIGFRSNLRANYPHISVTDVAKGDDSPEQTYQAVQALLEATPDLAALYNVAGGNAGLTQALRERGLNDRIRVVAHEANAVTLPLVRDGALDFVLAQSPLELVQTLMRVIAGQTGTESNGSNLIDFGIYTRFNLPSFGLE